MIGLDFGLGALEQDMWRVVFLMTRLGAALLAAPFFRTRHTRNSLRSASALSSVFFKIKLVRKRLPNS